jgi:hypothetical protein
VKKALEQIKDKNDKAPVQTEEDTENFPDEA